MLLRPPPNGRGRNPRIILGSLLLVLLLRQFAIAPQAALSTADRAPTGPGTLGGIVRIPFESQAELAQLASRLDIWEVHAREEETKGHLIARLASRADMAWLETLGVQPEIHTPLFAAPTTIPLFPCYRTISELNAQLSRWATDYPTLTELRAIGASSESRPLHALRLTNERVGLDKPVLVIMAGIHGRELITPEVAMAFAARMLEGYGKDADITWLLDHHQIEVLVSANPDGHVRNEAGQPWAYWRKNANPTNGFCDGTRFGIDLNRNSTYQWGGIGASSHPCDDVYRGPAAASESETQAVQAFLQAVFPDQRPDDNTTPTPAETSGLFITLHSYGNLVLWPWSYSYAEAPNAAALETLGRRLALFGGYTPKQASDLYPASGTTDDFVYGELGIASYTFEIGSSTDGFYPPCARYDELVLPNVEALLYAARVTQAPYLAPAGPDTSQVNATLASEPVTPTLSITARVAESRDGLMPITQAEAYIDAPPWAGGTPYALTAEDGAFDDDAEIVSGTITAVGLNPGQHIILVRGQGGSGVWGPLTAAFVRSQPEPWPYAVALPLVRK